MNTDDFPVTDLSKTAAAKVSVKLHRNNFAKEGTENYYGKVDRNTYSTENILHIMKDDVPLLDLGTIASVLNAYSSAVFKVLKDGNSVKFGKMGTFYITGKGTVTKENEKPELTVKFSISEELKAAVSNIEVSSASFFEPSGKIISITDISTGMDDLSLKAGCSVAIEGDKLKVLGEDSGIWLSPAEDGGVLASEDEWIKVETPLYCNTSTKLLFTLPESVDSGMYRIVIRSRYCNKANYERKSILQTVSEVVTIY